MSELIDNAASGAELAADGRFGPELATRAGRIIGSLHRLPADEIWPGGSPGDRRPALPSETMLRGLSWTAFCACSAGELRALRLMQDDEVLASAVGGLLAREARAPRVPAHCDLRLDQFLLADGQLYVTDWEEFRLADAARDVGSFAGEVAVPGRDGMGGSGRGARSRRGTSARAGRAAAVPPGHRAEVRGGPRAGASGDIGVLVGIPRGAATS